MFFKLPALAVLLCSAVSSIAQGFEKTMPGSYEIFTEARGGHGLSVTQEDPSLHLTGVVSDPKPWKIEVPNGRAPEIFNLLNTATNLYIAYDSSQKIFTSVQGARDAAGFAVRKYGDSSYIRQVVHYQTKLVWTVKDAHPELTTALDDAAKLPGGDAVTSCTDGTFTGTIVAQEPTESIQEYQLFRFVQVA